MQELPDPFNLYASHTEQVIVLPAEAVIITQADDCPVSGFTIGDHIFTAQHHPEMTRPFMMALTEELAAHLSAEQLTAAQGSFRTPADTNGYATTVARFFEQGAKAL